MKRTILIIILWILLTIVVWANRIQEVEINKLKRENYELIRELRGGNEL